MVDREEVKIVTDVYIADSVATLQELIDEAKSFSDIGVLTGVTITEIQNLGNRMEAVIDELEPKVKLYGYSD